MQNYWFQTTVGFLTLHLSLVALVNDLVPATESAAPIIQQQVNSLFSGYVQSSVREGTAATNIQFIVDAASAGGGGGNNPEAEYRQLLLSKYKDEQLNSDSIDEHLESLLKGESMRKLNRSMFPLLIVFY